MEFDEAIRAMKPRFTRLRVRPDRTGTTWTAEVRGPFTRVANLGASRAEAEDGLIRQLGAIRLPATLAAAGWAVTGRIVDELEVVTATSPDGEVWGIAVAGTRDAMLIDLVRSLSPGCDAYAVIEPLPTQDPSSLREALTAGG